jgi:putative cardiolipin synthase
MAVRGVMLHRQTGPMKLQVRRFRPFARAGSWLALALVLLFTACSGSLPSLERAPSYALPDPDATALGSAAEALRPADPALSGFHLLGNPRTAFASQLGLAAAAERSLDLQYYSWHDDTAGWLLFRALYDAAERGVRVRLLLDDLHTVGLDRALLQLDAHPSIEVRLFNPFPNRYMRLVDLVLDFHGSNQRMHNKSFTADGSVATAGGRNIGDAYAGLAGDDGFTDLDLLAVGPIVTAITAQFDAYWNSVHAYPAASIIDPWLAPTAAYLARRFEDELATPRVSAYLESLDPALLAAPLESLELTWARARLIVDPPEKIAGTAGLAADFVIPNLLASMRLPEARLDIVSAYLVMSRPWIDVLGEWVDRGVEIRILTNSLSGIDVPIAHGGHLIRRRPLLLAGVELWEMKAGSADPHFGEPDPGRPSSGGTLHAKAAAIDGKRLFVGSLNLDQRSAWLNTEMGIVIESPELATLLHRWFDDELATYAYRVEIAERSRLAWIETTPEGEIRYDREPGAGLLRWLGAGLAALLPIHWLL